MGMKSRGVYETPGGTILLTARRAIESICLDRGELHLKVGLNLLECSSVFPLVRASFRIKDDAYPTVVLPLVGLENCEGKCLNRISFVALWRALHTMLHGWYSVVAGNGVISGVTNPVLNFRWRSLLFCDSSGSHCAGRVDATVRGAGLQWLLV